MPDLADRIASATKGILPQLAPDVHKAALQARPAGDRLQREREARPVVVPTPMAAQTTEIQRLQARCYAVKQGRLLSHEMLLALPPSRIASVLEERRKAGLLEEGPAWALRQREMATLVKTIGPA